MISYTSIEELCSIASNSSKKISQIVLKDQAIQMEKTEDELFENMKERFNIMLNSINFGKNPNLKSTSGLTGGDASKIEKYAKTGGICGEFINLAIMRSIAVSEYNAAMGKIVAAPTAGSCGILPACIFSALENKKCDETQAIMSLFTAGAFGMVIANKASISGAEGGCQAECGSASAMAAAALVELYGGSPNQSAHACAMAIKNQLGLVCDPVAGLVEIPCIKRNASGTMIALCAAEMALANVESKIPVDECITAMKQVGNNIPCSLKETSQGGLAITKTGIKLKNEIFGK